jgi:O-antigen/teichoic acid export membrane protein
MARQYADAGLLGLRLDTLRFAVLGAAVVTPLAIGLAVLGPWLIEVGYGYSGSEATIALLAVYCWIQMMDVVAGNALLALGQTQLNFLADAFRCVGLVLPAYPLIAGQGVVGAAWCLVLGVATGLALRIVLVTKHVFRADATASRSGHLVVAQSD